MIFNEDKLQEEIIKTWGEFGVHNEVFTAMRKQISDLKQLTIPVVVDSEAEVCGKPNCNKQKLDNSPLCSYHWDIANS